jgi:hypothetical protein
MHCVSVTTPPEIILYYHLNHSIWSLSDNKEASCWVLPGLHPVNHLETQRGSNECIKLPRRRVQSTVQIIHLIPIGVIITNIVLWHESKLFRVYWKQRKITKRYYHIIGGLSMMQSLFVIHPFQLPAGWKFSGPPIRCITWNNIYKARRSILILSKTYPSKRRTLPLVMQGFWLVGLFAKELLCSESLLSHFSSSSSWSHRY